MTRHTRRLRKPLRDLIRESFANAVDRIGEEEYFYIGKRIEPKLHALSVSATHWVRELARKCEAIHSLYLQHADGEVSLTPKDVQLMGAALFYFINPFDVIPDHIPGEGYLDDDYVVDLCLKRLDNTTRERIDRLLASESPADGDQ